MSVSDSGFASHPAKEEGQATAKLPAPGRKGLDWNAVRAQCADMFSDVWQRLVPAVGALGRALAPVTEPAIRVIAGLSLVMHGYPKLFGATTANAAFFHNAGYRPGLFWAIVVGLTETLGGLCLAAGFLTRVVAVPILIFLMTAVTYHWQFGFYWNSRGFEYPLFWALAVLHFLVHGGGPWSVDARFASGIGSLGARGSEVARRAFAVVRQSYTAVAPAWILMAKSAPSIEEEPMGIVQSIALVAARICVGALFIIAAYNKFTNFDGTTAYFASLGIPLASIVAPVAALFELAVGLLLIVGFQTRIVALAVAAFVLVATYYAHMKLGDANQLNHFLKNLAIVGGCLALFCSGGGALSLDTMLRRRPAPDA